MRGPRKADVTKRSAPAHAARCTTDARAAPLHAPLPRPRTPWLARPAKAPGRCDTCRTRHPLMRRKARLDSAQAYGLRRATPHDERRVRTRLALAPTTMPRGYERCSACSRCASPAPSACTRPALLTPPRATRPVSPQLDHAPRQASAPFGFGAPGRQFLFAPCVSTIAPLLLHVARRLRIESSAWSAEPCAAAARHTGSAAACLPPRGSVRRAAQERPRRTCVIATCARK